MSEINPDVIQRLRKAAKERSGKDFTESEVEHGIAAYFDPTIPPPHITPEQMDDIVDLLLGREPN